MGPTRPGLQERVNSLFILFSDVMIGTMALLCAFHEECYSQVIWINEPHLRLSKAGVEFDGIISILRMKEMLIDTSLNFRALLG